MNRTIVEIVLNSDKSYSSQIIFAGTQSDDEKAGKGLSAYLTWFEGEDIISILAENKTADSNFTYNSILNKKNVKPEEMSNGMEIISKASFVKGVASYEDKGGE